MASNSKSINLGGANVYVQRCVLTAWFNENSTSTANNTSNITCRASLYTPSAAWNNGSGRNDNLRFLRQFFECFHIPHKNKKAK